MGRRKQPQEYFEARRALAQHMYRHHVQATGEGTLANRLDQHEELHFRARQRGVTIDHTHEPCAEGENDFEIAFRALREGGQQHGQADAASD